MTDRLEESRDERLACLNNVEEAGIIYGTCVCDVGDIKGKPEMAIAYEMGKTV